MPSLATCRPAAVVVMRVAYPQVHRGRGGRQLAASQPAPAAWQAMRRACLVSLVRVRAATQPAGAPAPAPDVVYLRVYATRVTTTAAGRQASGDGITVQLTRSGSRWLVSAVLFY